MLVHSLEYCYTHMYKVYYEIYVPVNEDHFDQLQAIELEASSM